MSSSTKRIKLVVAYDGTDFCGFAPQRGHRTVHGTLTETVRQISGDDCEITGASRTDSGAHARGQVVHFDTQNPMPSDRWPRALNPLLPPDLAVVQSSAVSLDFHSRFWADARWYRYRIATGPRDPFRDRFAFWTHWNLDLELMRQTADLLIGEHDFRAFSQQLEPETNTIRTLFRVGVRRVRDEVWIDVVGTAFVRGMMRRISGALWEVGHGLRRPEDVGTILRHPEERFDWPRVLPACGLTLMKVAYGRHPFDRRRSSEAEDQDE